MSTAVKFFHSEMPSAPVLSGTAGSLLAILDACLVNGWGLMTATSVVVSGGVATANFSSGHVFEPGRVAIVAGATPSGLNGEQRLTGTAANSVSWATTVPDGTATGTITLELAPAGWVKSFSSGNVAAYKSGSPSASGCYVRIDDSGTMTARFRAFESMTDVDTGVGPTPTDSQQSGGLYIYKSEYASSAGRRWIVLADDRLVFILVGYHGSYPNDYDPICFGDMVSLKSGDAYPFLVAGNTGSAVSQYVGSGNALTSNSSASGVFVVRSYTQSGGAITAQLSKPGLWGGSGQTNLPLYPNPVNNSMEICPTVIYEGINSTAARRGDLPGLYGIPHAMGTNLDSKQTVSDIDGLPGHVLMGVRYSSASYGAGYRYAIDITGPWR